MANYSAIINGGTTGTTLTQQVFVSGVTANPFSPQFYNFELFNADIILFNMNGINGGGTIDLEFGLYQKIGGTFTQVALSTINTPTVQLQYSGQIAEFVIHIVTNSPSTSYNLSYDLAGGLSTPLASTEIESGSEISITLTRDQSFGCEQPVGYKIIDGVLPDGLTMETNGFITGTPTELDCQADMNGEASFSFFKQQDDGSWIATTRDYPITVRASLIKPNGDLDDDATDDRSFLICVQNNWDSDKAAWRIQQPDFEKEVFTLEQPYLAFPPVADSVPEPDIKVDTLPQTMCDLTTLPPETLELFDIVDNNLIPKGLEVPGYDLSAKLLSQCMPCPEPDTEIKLQTIPSSMCSIKNATVEDVACVKVLYKDVTLNSGQGLYNDMLNKNICKNILTVPDNTPVIPNTVCDDEPIVLHSNCTPCSPLVADVFSKLLILDKNDGGCCR